MYNAQRKAVVDGVVETFNSRRFQDENAELKAKIVEWQMATMPAVIARGWQSEIPTFKLAPRDLLEALNPCMPAATSVTKVMYHPTACASVVDGHTYIEIVLKR